jgi:hypothetical protein
MCFYLKGNNIRSTSQNNVWKRKARLAESQEGVALRHNMNPNLIILPSASKRFLGHWLTGWSRKERRL